MMRWVPAAAALWAFASVALAAEPPAAIFTDPPHDAAHPAHSEVIHIPSGGVEVNGLVYVASGAGAHPTVLLLHGLPGNEKNLDLAQAMRRAGWTVVTMNYRGSWGSPGRFSFMGNLEDARHALAYIRTPEVAAKLQIDPAHIVVIGHSMGGWVSAMTSAIEPGVEGAVVICGADMSREAKASQADRLKLARDNMETLATTDQDMARQLANLGEDVSFAAAAPKLANRPLLVLTADDGLAPQGHALAEAARKAGGTNVTEIHVATDHSWNDQRIRLESEVLTWLDHLPK